MLLTLPHHRHSISYEPWAEVVSKRPSFKLFFRAFYSQLQKNESWFWGGTFAVINMTYAS